MKKQIIVMMVSFFIILGIIFGIRHFFFNDYIKENKDYTINIADWNPVKAHAINQGTIVANIDLKQIKSTADNIMFFNDNMRLMLSVDKITEGFDCAVLKYTDGNVLVEKGSNSLKINTTSCSVNGEKGEYIDSLVVVDDEEYISMELLSQVFGYSYSYDSVNNQATLVSDAENAIKIPLSYSYEEVGKAPKVSNQGSLGTCWAFAALTALSSTLMPGEVDEFSVDHMTMANSFNLTDLRAGDYNMAAAYLLAWQGPVYESDDPYGDNQTNTNLSAVKHVQEIQILNAKDLESIKETVFKYGGVQSSFYAYELSESTKNNKYYNKDTNSYCYVGDEKPNHDIVIIGWDDNYSKDNFNTEVEGDGAFLCRNSWGDDFGDNGDFYISYYDSNIGNHAVAYTRVDDVDNYDNIYQTDLCGLVGQLGYGETYAYFSNVYTANNDEEIKAVGFYATDANTEYSVYICDNYEDMSSLSNRSDPVINGSIKNAGFYTIDLNNKIDVKEGQKFAIIVRVSTPNSTRPVAVEYANDEYTENVTIDDGDGYVSLKGSEWEKTEDTYGCNVCLKVYSDNLSKDKK